MANHKSALKRIRRNEAVKLRNKLQHKSTRNAIKKLKDLRLINISNVVLKGKFIPIKNVLWTEQIQYIELNSAKLGLAPLDNSNWSKGKCAFKVLQYASAGIPIISSNEGVNSILIKQFDAGLLVKKDNDWIKHIQKMRLNPNLYKMYKKNAEKMSRSYDLSVNYKKMKKIVKDAL